MNLSQRAETTLVLMSLKILRRVNRGSFAFVSLIHTCLDILQHFDTNAYYQRLLTAAAWRGLEPALGSRSEGPTFIIHVAFNTVMFRSCRPPNDNSAPAAHFQQNLFSRWCEKSVEAILKDKLRLILAPHGDQHRIVFLPQ